MHRYEINRSNPLYWIERVIPKSILAIQISLEDWHDNSSFEYEMSKYLRECLDNKNLSEVDLRSACITYLTFIVLANFSVTINFSSLSVCIKDDILCLSGYSESMINDLEYDFTEYLKRF